ncbi:SHOCT domain-containing protein [Lactobacillaceae bacterium Scapto_B20]
MLYAILIIIVVALVIYVLKVNRHQQKYSQSIQENVNTIQDTDNIEVKLHKLKDLLDKGAIDKEDYEQAKRQILDKKI